MIVFLSKSDVSAGFDQIVDFLNSQVIQYAFTVDPIIYANDVVKLQALTDRKKVVITEDVIRKNIRLDDADGVECFPNEEICAELARMGYEKPPPKLTIGKGFFGVETPLFAAMLVQPQATKVEEDVEVPAAPTLPSPTSAPSPPPQDPIPTSLQAQPASPSSPPQEQPTKLEKTRRSKHSGLKRLKKVGTSQRVESSVDTVVEDVSAATKDANVAEPTMFDDEEVTMTIAQTLIKIKAEKAKLLDEQLAKRLHNEEVEQATAREKQEKDDLERAQVLQQQYDDKEENIDWNAVAEQIQEKHLDNIKKYQSLKRKPISIAQARKNMIIYLKNMAGYTMEHFKGMAYDKKRVAEETLLQESFKKLKSVEVSGFESTQETPTINPKEMSEEDVQNMLEIVPVFEFKVEALQVKVHQVSSTTRRHDMFILTEKNYPLSDRVMTLMLSAKLQVEEDSDMARDLVIKIFMKDNKPKIRSLDTSSK
nr:hypothetical protein [Tanacetum cinerariifolium]